MEKLLWHVTLSQARIFIFYYCTHISKMYTNVPEKVVKTRADMLLRNRRGKNILYQVIYQQVIVAVSFSNFCRLLGDMSLDMNPMSVMRLQILVHKPFPQSWDVKRSLSCHQGWQDKADVFETADDCFDDEVAEMDLNR